MTKQLRALAGKLLDGWSFIRIAKWLNETGAKTNKARAGGKSATWTVATVMDAMTSPRNRRTTAKAARDGSTLPGRAATR
jgi:hypothetical protein